MKSKAIILLLVLSLLIPVVATKAATTNNLNGKILLQVESKGEAWYVSPKDGKRYYMANGDQAFQIMKTLGIGMSNKDVDRMKTDVNFRKKFIGKILLQVESKGEAYYISSDGRYNYLKDGASAYQVMRKLGLGISNANLNKITEYKVNNQSQPVAKETIKEDVVKSDSSCPTTVKYEGGPYNENGTATSTNGYYRAVKIGNQCWFRDNLNVGTMIMSNKDQLNNKVFEKYCYDNKEEDCKIYGGLYQWAEAVQYSNNVSNTIINNLTPDNNIKGVCPSGWHVPTDSDWTILTDYLGGSTLSGLKLKASVNDSVSWDGTNSSKFSIISSGYRNFGGSFGNFGTAGYMWSSSIFNESIPSVKIISSWSRNVGPGNSSFNRGVIDRVDGFSIRCLKD